MQDALQAGMRDRMKLVFRLQIRDGLFPVSFLQCGNPVQRSAFQHNAR